MALDQARAQAEAGSSVDHDAPVLRSLFSSGVTQRLKRRQKVKLDELSGPHLFFVQQGVLATQLEMAGARRSLVSFHFAGDIIASEQFAGMATSAISLTSSQVRALPLRTIEAKFAGNEVAASALVHALERQARFAHLHCAMLMQLTGEERVATFLILLALRQVRTLAEQRIDVPMPVGRKDIGDYLGLNADTVSRIFTRLRQSGVIEPHGRSEAGILDWRALCSLSPLSAAFLQGDNEKGGNSRPL